MLSLHGTRYESRRLGLHPWKHVRVLLEREPRRLMAEALADHLHGHAGLDGERRVRVAEVVHEFDAFVALLAPERDNGR